MKEFLPDWHKKYEDAIVRAEKAEGLARRLAAALAPQQRGVDDVWYNHCPACHGDSGFYERRRHKSLHPIKHTADCPVVEAAALEGKTDAV